MTEELCQLAQAEGIDHAFRWAEARRQEWPGCDSLAISLSMTLNGLLFTLAVEEPEPYQARLEELNQALADSEDRDVRDQALHLLIGRHMEREEYGQAEALLGRLSDRWPYRDSLRAGLLRRTGRTEAAAELWERHLLNAATECYEALVSLQELALRAGELETGRRLAALITETAERYAMPPGTAPAGRLQQDAELFRQREQELVSALTPGVLVTGDPSLLGRAVGNLLSNAALYSPQRARIRVWCGFRDSRPALTVENTGARIPEEALPHLFEAFYRAETSRNRSTGGSGLGLYLVKMILDRHEATCTVENAEDGVKVTAQFLPCHSPGLPTEDMVR